jgi:hypothetical protein
VEFLASAAFIGAQALYLFAPLLLAAALSGVVLRWNLVPWLRRPIDGGQSWRNRRLFGDNKSWRGVVVAVFGSVVAVVIQKHVVGAWAAPIAVIEYRDLNAVAFGAAIGAGAMLGELPNSFVKRRLGIPPGGNRGGAFGVVFWAWDQVDLLTGAWPSIWPWVHPSLSLVLASVVFAFAFHPLVALIGYLTGARTSAR